MVIITFGSAQAREIRRKIFTGKTLALKLDSEGFQAGRTKNQTPDTGNAAPH